MSDDKVKKTQPARAVKTVKKESTIYVGPNLRSGALMSFQVFKDGEYPVHVLDLIEKNPTLKALFVPISDLSDARADLQDSTSALSTIYKEIMRG